MATNRIYDESRRLNRDVPLSLVTAPATPTSIQPGVPVLFGERPAVSITASGNATVTVANPAPGLTSLTYGNGGVGNSADPASATFAFDGTWEFAVTGATTTTASEVEVFITTTGTLTLTEGTNTHYGWTDYPTDYAKAAGRAPVRIGA